MRLREFALARLDGARFEVLPGRARKIVDENYSIVLEPSIVGVPGRGDRFDLHVGVDSHRHNRLIAKCTEGLGPLTTRTRIDSDRLWFPYFSYGTFAGYFWSATEVGLPLPPGDKQAEELIAAQMALAVSEAVPAMGGFIGDRTMYGFVRHFARPVEPWEMACAIFAVVAGKAEDAVAMYTMNQKILSGPDRAIHAEFWSRLSSELPAHVRAGASPEGGWTGGVPAET
jgi:hypothetical protein